VEVEVCLSAVRSVGIKKHVLCAADVAGECACGISDRDSGSAHIVNRALRQRRQDSEASFLSGSLGSFLLVLHSCSLAWL
jgi:hypothetical protein